MDCRPLVDCEPCWTVLSLVSSLFVLQLALTIFFIWQDRSAPSGDGNQPPGGATDRGSNSGAGPDPSQKH